MRRAALQMIYLALVMFFFVIMRTGICGAWQPVFLIPLAASYAMYSGETAACLFSALCGTMTDIACGYVLGSGALMLMAVCVAASLLTRNYIRVNMLVFMLIAAAAILMYFSAGWLVNVLMCDVPRGEVILTASVIPSAAATAVVSPAVFMVVSATERRSGRKREVRL